MKKLTLPFPLLVILILIGLQVDHFGQTVTTEHSERKSRLFFWGSCLDDESLSRHSSKHESVPLVTTGPSQPWTLVPSSSYSFLNNGRADWQRHTLDIFYQYDQNVLLGTSVDYFKRPPNKDDIMYSFNASWYPRKNLELHAEISVTPDAHFLPDTRYSAGLQYTLNPKVTLLFDAEHLVFDSNATRPDYDISQIKPGVAYWLTEKTSLTLRYTHGWLHDSEDYDYYSAAIKFVDLPRDGQLTLGFAYGTDPDLDFGATGATLSDAYTGSVFYKQPIKPNLSFFTGIEYVYRMRPDSNGELYQSYTPTIGLIWKF